MPTPGDAEMPPNVIKQHTQTGMSTVRQALDRLKITSRAAGLDTAAPTFPNLLGKELMQRVSQLGRNTFLVWTEGHLEK